MKKSCACGRQIPNHWYLCKECLDIYGTVQKEWPAWLSYNVGDIQRVWDRDRDHDEIAYNDEFNYVDVRTTVEGQYYTSKDGWGPYSDS
jgi:hypothetical protein